MRPNPNRAKGPKASKPYRRVKGPVLHLKYLRKDIYVLGTAHVSHDSVEDVKNFVDTNDPDVICVELCPSRFQALTDRDRWRRLDIVQVIKGGKIYLLMSSMLLSSFQKKLGDDNEVTPGQEMITAIKIAKKTNKPLELVDRDIQVTLRRAWQGMGYFTKVSLLSEMLVGGANGIEADQIEEMKRKDVLDDLFENLPIRFRKIKEILITERDRYLAQKIKNVARKRKKAKSIFAIVGAGHLPGIKKFFYTNTNLREIEKVKLKSKAWAIIKFLLPIFIIMGVLSAFADFSTWEKVRNSLVAWVVIKAGFSAFFALIMWVHPLAILAAAVTGPIANFNPVLKPGWAAALIEAKFRKPDVSDFENIAKDTATFLGFFRNKVVRIFMAFILPQLGSLAGTIVATWYIVGQ